jgi:TatD DNase family protein
MSQEQQPPALVDIGANLCHESFRADLSSVLDRAFRAGVRQLVITGSDAESNRGAIALTRAHPHSLYATAGLHPHWAAQYDADYESELKQHLAQPEVRAVGETGLDYFRDLAPRPAQQFAFERHVELAIACGKPMFLHMRDAHADFHAILKSARDRLAAVVVHCFTGSRAELYAYLDLDCHIGITGWICDERRGLELRELVREIPPDRLMIESDAPYLLPRTMKPLPKHRRNEPAFLPWVAAMVAECRGETLAELAARSSATARSFFAL